MLVTVLDTFKSSLLVTGVVAYMAYYRKYYGQVPKLYSKHKGVFSTFLETNVKSIKESYWPFYFLPSGKYQTILATLLPCPSKIDYTRETITNVDGGQFVLAWAGEPGQEDAKKVLLISPGLTSASNTNYVQSLIADMIKQGYKCVLIVNRGLELPLKTPKAYCATHTIDLSAAVQHVRKVCPQATLYGVGISLGGVILSHYLSLTKEKSEIDAAFVCSSPLNTVATSASIERWDNWLLYGYHLTRNLKFFYQRSQEMFNGVVDHDAIMASNSVRAFDENFTIKTFGYKTVDHYYEDATMTEDKILSIRTPTLYICADDDAFIPVNSTPYKSICKSDYVAMLVTNGGGHVAHLQGVSPFDTPYYMTVLTDYLEAIHENCAELKQAVKAADLATS